ncbi:hypothetical protein F5Y15DRAFT_427941 [Xylariaceae sp. FL0016]|nr:hypothetical protein F5Y15DRAFT_427941 [Xylariaceae sp. FL0016]
MPRKKATAGEEPVSRSASRNVTKQSNAKPIAAGRLIASPYAEYGWHTSLKEESREVVKSVKKEANAMLCLQIERDRPVDWWSMRYGVFWEHRHLADPEIVSTPAADHLDLWGVGDEGAFRETLARMRRQFSVDGFVTFHYLFETIRQREFLLWPVEIQGIWVTIFLRMQAKQDVTPKRPEDCGDPRNFTDREVTDLVIVDSVEAGCLERRKHIVRKLQLILLEACIEFRADLKWYPTRIMKTESPWESGFIAYAMSREFIRRLKIVHFRRTQFDHDDLRILWTNFEEHLNVDEYRESLMSACAHLCIQNSGYEVRMALEVPSAQSRFYPKMLDRSKAPSVTSPPKSVADERWEALQEPKPTHTCSLEIPEDFSPRHQEDMELTENKKSETGDEMPEDPKQATKTDSESGPPVTSSAPRKATDGARSRVPLPGLTGRPRTLLPETRSRTPLPEAKEARRTPGKELRVDSPSIDEAREAAKTDEQSVTSLSASDTELLSSVEPRSSPNREKAGEVMIDVGELTETHGSPERREDDKTKEGAGEPIAEKILDKLEEKISTIPGPQGCEEEKIKLDAVASIKYEISDKPEETTAIVPDATALAPENVQLVAPVAPMETGLETTIIPGLSTLNSGNIQPRWQNVASEAPKSLKADDQDSTKDITEDNQVASSTAIVPRPAYVEEPESPQEGEPTSDPSPDPSSSSAEPNGIERQMAAAALNILDVNYPPSTEEQTMESELAEAELESIDDIDHERRGTKRPREGDHSPTEKRLRFAEGS